MLWPPVDVYRPPNHSRTSGVQQHPLCTVAPSACQAAKDCAAFEHLPALWQLYSPHNDPLAGAFRLES